MTKRAVVIGINDYANQRHLNWQDLSAAVADADAMFHLLVGAFGFWPTDILLLKDATASRRNILSALAHQLGRSGPGDVVCFFFAGHGGVVPVTNAEDNTRYHESIIPHSGLEIFDAEIRRLADRVDKNEVNLTFVIDSCHSGGVHPTSAIEQSIPRSVPFDPDIWASFQTADEWHPFGICLPDDVVEFFPNVENLRVEDNRLVDLDEHPDKTFVDAQVSNLFAACRYYEFAGEGSTNGHFTQAIIDVVNSGNYRATHQEFHDRVRQRTLTLSGGDQTPIVRGQAGRMDEVFLDPWNTSIP